jgi:hypothetical protein
MKKRKYNHSGKYKKVLKQDISSIPLHGIVAFPETTPEQFKVLKEKQLEKTSRLKDGERIFTFEDLPLSIRSQIERDIQFRKNKGLFDDSKERKQRAIDYWRQNESR